MDSSYNDWDLQALVRSCGGTAAMTCNSGATTTTAAARGEDYAGAPKQAAAAVACVGSRANDDRSAAAPEFLGKPVLSAASSWRGGIDYLDLQVGHDDDLRMPFSITPTPASGLQQLHRDVLFSFPAAAAAVSTSTSGQQQQPRKQPGRKLAGARTPRRPKRSKKSQLKKVVCEVPVADGGVSTDLWAWRKYGQKPIKGSPYPRGYYKCSSLKSCMARKLVERSPADPGVLVVTYIADHCHAVPTMLNALAGTTRNKSASSSPDDDGASAASGSADNNKLDDADADADAASSSMTVDGGGGCDDAAWQQQEVADHIHMALDDYPLDDFFMGPLFDDDDLVDRVFDDDDVLERRLSP